MRRQPKACCQMMAAQLDVKCDQHAPEDCPDVLIGYFSSTGDYGLRVHDGGSSMVIVDFRPWCGTKLRPTTRGPLVRSKRLTREALPEGVQPRTPKRPGGALPGRRIEV